MKKEAQIVPGESISQAQKALQLAIMGASLADIQAQLVGTDREKCDIMLQIAEYFKTLSEWDTKQEKGKAYATLSVIVLNSFRIQDYKTALAARKEMSKMLDLYKPTDPMQREAETIDLDSLLK